LEVHAAFELEYLSYQRKDPVVFAWANETTSDAYREVKSYRSWRKGSERHVYNHRRL